MPGCANEGTVAPAVDRAESVGLMMGLPAARLGSMGQLSGGWQTRCRVAHMRLSNCEMPERLLAYTGTASATTTRVLRNIQQAVPTPVRKLDGHRALRTQARYAAAPP